MSDEEIIEKIGKHLEQNRGTLLLPNDERQRSFADYQHVTFTIGGHGGCKYSYNPRRYNRNQYGVRGFAVIWCNGRASKFSSKRKLVSYFKKRLSD